MHIGFWWGNLRQGDHLQDIYVDGRIILKGIVNKDGRFWTGLFWLKVRKGDGLF